MQSVNEMTEAELRNEQKEKYKRMQQHHAIARRSPEENKQLLELMRELYGMKS